MLSSVHTARVEHGECIARSMRFGREEVSLFARLAGDENPLHHDAQYALQTRFGALVVSGPHLASVLMGMTATHFSTPSPKGIARAMLGLDFRFRFRRAVLVDQSVSCSWQVVAVRKKDSLGGELAFLVGRVRDALGEDAVKAVGKILVVERL